MVIFDSAVRGTAPEVWRDSARLAAVPALELPHVDHVVAVAAHPDDESLGAGGLIHRLGQAGASVHVVVVTDGDASHPHSRTHDATQLARMRARETDAAAQHLAPGAVVHRFGLPDGGVREHRREALAALDALLAELDGDVLVLSTWRGDGHRDHRVVGEVCAEVCAGRRLRLLEYPVWMWHWATPASREVPWARLRRVALGPDDARAKSAAIDAYASQITPLSSEPGDEAVLLPEFVRHARTGPEIVIAPDYFDELYARHDDPWGYDSRWYERRKRAVTTAVLRRERYGRALELGCATGALTAELAPRCDELIAVDAATAAVSRARARLKGMDHVTVLQGDVADGIPPGRFDLVVLSEIGYYLAPATLTATLASVRRALTDRGELLLCHWRHSATQFQQSAHDVHTAAERLGLARQVRHEEPDLLLDLYSVDANSVARLEGLA